MEAGGNQTVMAALGAVCLGLAGFALKATYDTNAEIRELKVNQSRILQVLENDEAHAKFWRIHTQTKDAINEDRQKTGAPLFKWDLKD